MVDVVDKITRSRMMAGIRGKNTKPERQLRSALHRLGLRFRLHRADLPGRPDIVLPRHQAAILIHGCFWHRHENCAYATLPASNRAFWTKKFERNIERNARNLAKLRLAGWRVAVVWECSIRKTDTNALAATLNTWLKSKSQFKEISSRHGI